MPPPSLPILKQAVNSGGVAFYLTFVTPAQLLTHLWNIQLWSEVKNILVQNICFGGKSHKFGIWRLMRDFGAGPPDSFVSCCPGGVRRPAAKEEMEDILSKSAN